MGNSLTRIGAWVEGMLPGLIAIYQVPAASGNKCCFGVPFELECGWQTAVAGKPLIASEAGISIGSVDLSEEAPRPAAGLNFPVWDTVSPRSLGKEAGLAGPWPARSGPIAGRE